MGRRPPSCRSAAVPADPLRVAVPVQYVLPPETETATASPRSLTAMREAEVSPPALSRTGAENPAAKLLGAISTAAANTLTDAVRAAFLRRRIARRDIRPLRCSRPLFGIADCSSTDVEGLRALTETPQSRSEHSPLLLTAAGGRAS